MLTTLSNVKSRLGLELFDPTDDALLTNILKHVSGRFALECNRIFDYASGLTFEFPAEDNIICVDHPPVESVTAFHLKSREAEGWVLQSAVSFLIAPKRTVIELADSLGSVGEIARVTYTGGFILPGTQPAGSQVALPDEIEQACVEQVAYWYQRRSQLGLASVSNESGIVQQFQSTDLLPQVRAVLKRYVRWVN